MTEDQKTAPEDFEKFASQALRRNKLGSYEQLLCQHLIKSVASEPIEKIRLVAEAAYMVPSTPVDEEILDIIYSVVTSFIGTEIIITNPDLFFGKIAWGFQLTDENYEKYILPWFKGFGRLFLTNRAPNSEKIEEMENSPLKFWNMTAFSKIFPTSVEYMKTTFLVWAMPQIMVMFEQLSKLVNPDLYDSILEKMRV